MDIVDVSEILNNRGIQPPQLTALIPDCGLYSCALFQPKPDIEYSNEFVRNGTAEHTTQMEKFLELLESQNVNLGVTPEYSFPWSILRRCLQYRRFPGNGNLWVFGAESISFNDLNTLKNEVAADDLFIEIGTVSNPEIGNFVDPVCYMFRTIKHDGSQCNVVLVQCKTTQMGDRASDFFERNNLQRGSTIFEIKNRGENSISLFTLICSDVLGVEQFHNRFRSRCLLLNIQLNDNPRHDSIVTFKKSIYRMINENNEIICLNWSQNIRFTTGGQTDLKRNPSSSAIYSTSQDCSRTIERLNHNHAKGIYFSYWNSQRCNVMYLNYDPGVFIYRSTKCWQFDGVPTQMGRTGPESIDYYSWDETTTSWITDADPNDAFHDSLDGIGGNFEDLIRLKEHPILVEMSMALTLGETSTTRRHEDPKTNSFMILTEPEFPSRITFAQDATDRSLQLRQEAISKFGIFTNLLNSERCFPIQIRSLFNNSRFNYIPTSANYNLYSQDGKEAATIVFLGSNVSQQKIQRIYDDVKAKLQRDGHDTARLVVWHVDGHGQPQIFPPTFSTVIDETDTDHPATIDGDGK